MAPRIRTPGIARGTPGIARGTARLRLTLLYSGMFLLLGTAIVVIVFVFTSVGSHVSVSSAMPASAGAVESAGTHALSEVASQQQSSDFARLLTASWLVLLLTAGASTVLGWFIAGRVLRPLREMTLTAKSISAGNLGERLALSGPDDEFKRLGDTLDDLLARLQESFESQRRFVANAAHELRTPLTVDRTLLQVALADPHASADKLRAACEELLASGREQERLLDALLTLASSEGGLEHREPIDLAEIAGRVAAAAIEGRRITSSLAAAPISGEPALIERMLANLLDNAVRYNDARGLVELTTTGDGTIARLTVSNTGPVVPVEALQRLFEPFQRLGGRATTADDGHHGLGLSIVRAIAAAHGGRVDAEPREGGGLTVSVSFPVAPLATAGG
jgi:signal transduction histidine kinase